MILDPVKTFKSLSSRLKKVRCATALTCILWIAPTLAQAEESKSKSGQKEASGVQGQISQGLSMREALTLQSSSRWGYSLSTSSFRSLDFYAEDYLSLGADLSYSLSPGRSITASLSFLRPIDGLDPSPYRYGLTDLRVAYLVPRYITLNGGASINTSVGITLPTSERSQMETLWVSADASATLRKPLSGRLKIITLQTTGRLLASYHTHDTSNAFGTEFNSPLGAAIGGGAILSLAPGLFWSNQFSLYARMDYGNYWKLIETLSSTVSYIAGSSLSFYAQYRWRDEAITNDVFLDDDKSRILIGAAYFF